MSINTIGDIKDHKCNPRLNTEFDDNWYLHVATENGEMFGCSVPWHPKYVSKSKKKIDICRDSEAGKSAFKPDIKVKSTVMYYDSTTLAAEIGGYVGMFLGVSMVDLAMAFNFFFLIMMKRIS